MFKQPTRIPFDQVVHQISSSRSHLHVFSSSIWTSIFVASRFVSVFCFSCSVFDRLQVVNYNILLFEIPMPRGLLFTSTVLLPIGPKFAVQIVSKRFHVLEFQCCDIIVSVYRWTRTNFALHAISDDMLGDEHKEHRETPKHSQLEHLGTLWSEL